MNKIGYKPIVKWIIPIILLCIHIVYIEKIVYYNVRVLVHWGCYVILLVYLLCIGEIKPVFVEFKKRVKEVQFVLKVLGTFLLSFAIAMTIVYYFAKDLNVMYPLWQPLSKIGIGVWVILYIFLQPLVDSIIYHKWVLGKDRLGVSKMLILVVVMLRTFVETGIVIYSKDSSIPQEGFLSLACWSALCVFALSYILFKNIALTYTGEVLFRIALVMTIFIGMPQYYIPGI